MADEVAKQEEAELQAYLEMMEAEEAQSHTLQMPWYQQHQHQEQQQTEGFGAGQGVQHIEKSASDEIDYDKMFDDMNMGGVQDTKHRDDVMEGGVPEDENMMDMS